MSKDNLALVQSLYEAFGRGDIPTVLGTMSSDFRWIAAENSPLDRGRPYIGPQEILENVFMRIGSDWDGFKVLVDRYLDAGDTIVVEGRYGGTYKDTGKDTNAQVVHIWVARDGKLVEFRQYCDTAELRDTTGRSAQTGASGS